MSARRRRGISPSASVEPPPEAQALSVTELEMGKLTFAQLFPLVFSWLASWQSSYSFLKNLNRSATSSNFQMLPKWPEWIWGQEFFCVA